MANGAYIRVALSNNEVAIRPVTVSLQHMHAYSSGSQH